VEICFRRGSRSRWSFSFSHTLKTKLVHYAAYAAREAPKRALLETSKHMILVPWVRPVVHSEQVDFPAFCVVLADFIDVNEKKLSED